MATYLVLEEDYRKAIPEISVTETDSKETADRLLQEALDRYDIPEDDHMRQVARKTGRFYNRKMEYGVGYLLVQVLTNDEQFSWQ